VGFILKTRKRKIKEKLLSNETIYFIFCKS
jgi:hypothetical protein